MDEHGRLIWGVAWGAVSAVLASLGTALGVLIALMFADFITALIANARRGTISPEAGWYGWRRKANTIVLVLVIGVLQVWGPWTIQDLPAASAVAGGFAAIEFISVVRNTILTGVVLPTVVIDPFIKLVGMVEKKPPEKEG